MLGDTEVTESEHGRNEQGQFLKGKSGNPAGRPKGKKNEITELKQDLEIALRTHISQDQVKKIIDAMVLEALAGGVGAAKLILDKVLSNARDSDDASDNSGGITIRIENLTAAAMANAEPTGITIDVEPTTIEE